MKTLSRREVIRTFVLGTMFVTAAGRASAEALSFAIKPLSHNRVGLLVVPLADFPELNQPLGSVRITTSRLVPATAGGQKQAGLFPPIIIIRGEAGELYVKGADCTHEGCIVQELNPATKLINCSCLPPVHGSQYRIDGTVARGPARQPLQNYTFAENNGVIEIQLPNTFYEVKAERSSAPGRLLISFLALEEITYQIYFRPSLDAPVVGVNFATTPDGPVDQSEIAGPANGAFVQLYVQQPAAAGFFHVAMKTTAV